jgi:hypothetical protein
MARAYPHLTQSLLPGTVERVRYKQNRLRGIFERFAVAGKRRDVLTRDELLAMLTAIHTRTGQLMCEPWASANPEAKVPPLTPSHLPPLSLQSTLSHIAALK